MIYNFVFILGVQQSEPLIHILIHASTLFFFKILFPYGLLQRVEFPMSFAGTWMDLEIVILSEVREKQI